MMFKDIKLQATKLNVNIKKIDEADEEFEMLKNIATGHKEKNTALLKKIE